MRDTGRNPLSGGPAAIRQWWRGVAIAAAVFAVLGAQSARAGIYLSDDGPDEPASQTGVATIPAPATILDDELDLGMSGSNLPDSANGGRIYLSDGFSTLDVMAHDPSLDRHGQDISRRVRLAISGYDTMSAAYGDGGDENSAASPGTDRTLRDVLALYLNVVETGEPAGWNSGRTGRYVTTGDQPANPAGGGRSVVDALLSQSSDGDLANVIAFLARPRINESGLVSFSIAGAGDFAIVATDSADAVAIVDLETGKLFTLPGAGPDRQPRAMKDYGWRPDDPGKSSERSTGPGRVTRLVLLFLGHVLAVLTHPLTVGMAMSGVIFSALWLGRRKRTVFRRRRHA